MKLLNLIKSRAISIIIRIMLRVCPKYYALRLYSRSYHTHASFYGGYDGKCMAEYIDESLKIFLSADQLKNSQYVKDVIADIVLCHLKYGTNPTEYFCYGFLEKKDADRETYLPRQQKDICIATQIGRGWKECLDFTKDKNLFYKTMKPFFRREACRVEEQEDKAEFVKLFNKCGRLIVKPTRGGCGHGIEIISIADYKGEASAAFDSLIKKGAYIAEEVVEQDPRISRWNSSSINTFRIPVFRTKEGIKIFYPSIRIGRQGSIVDNAGAGGTFAAIDIETGIITTDGFDKHGNQFLVHPDSHIPYKGEQIPEWEALKTFVKEMHNAMPPEHKYIAYDMALSVRGWVVIEANWGEISMPQIEFGRGLKYEFEALLNG